LPFGRARRGKPLVANEDTAPDRKAVTFQIDFPRQSLKPGSIFAKEV